MPCPFPFETQLPFIFSWTPASCLETPPSCEGRHFETQVSNGWQHYIIIMSLFPPLYIYMCVHIFSLFNNCSSPPFLAANANNKSWTQHCCMGNATLNESMFHSLGMGLFYYFSLLYIYNHTPFVSSSPLHFFFLFLIPAASNRARRETPLASIISTIPSSSIVTTTIFFNLSPSLCEDRPLLWVWGRVLLG